MNSIQSLKSNLVNGCFGDNKLDVPDKIKTISAHLIGTNWINKFIQT